MAGLLKNVASQNITFGLVIATTGAALTGATVTTFVTKDGGAQATSSGTATSLGNGQYNFAPTQSDTNATDVGFAFTASTAIPVYYDFHTDVADANGYQSVNIVDIAGTASAGTAGYMGVDWGHVNAPTTTLGLTGTTISTSQAVASVSGAVGSVTGNVGGSVASVLTGGLIDLTSTTYGEPSGPVAATATLKDMIVWLKTLGRNKITQTSTTETLFKDDGSTAISTSTDSDDGTTFTRGKWS